MHADPRDSRGGLLGVGHRIPEPHPRLGQGSRVMPYPAGFAGGEGQAYARASRPGEGGAPHLRAEAGVPLTTHHSPVSEKSWSHGDPSSLCRQRWEPSQPRRGSPCPCHRQETRAQTDSSRAPDPGLLTSDALGRPAAPLPTHRGGHGAGSWASGSPPWSSGARRSR